MLGFGAVNHTLPMPACLLLAAILLLASGWLAALVLFPRTTVLLSLALIAYTIWEIRRAPMDDRPE